MRELDSSRAGAVVHGVAGRACRASKGSGAAARHQDL